MNIGWVYTSHHRYDSDLNEKVGDVVTKLVAETGSQELGESGGSGFSQDPHELVADSVHHLLVPDLEAAERIRVGVDQMLKFYDDCYEATLSVDKDKD